MTSNDVLMAEYEQLKREQVTRISTRDNLIYATLAGIAAVCVAAFQSGRPAVLLAVPVVCVTLGWTYVRNDMMITAIGRYIRTRLTPAIAAQTGMAAAEVFGWESHRGRRPGQKVAQMLVDLLLFVAPSVAALVAAGRLSPSVWWLAATAAVGGGAAVLLGLQILRVGLGQALRPPMNI